MFRALLLAVQKSQAVDPEVVRQRAVFKLATKLLQLAHNSRLEERSLRAYLASLHQQYSQRHPANPAQQQPHRPLDGDEGRQRRSQNPTQPRPLNRLPDGDEGHLHQRDHNQHSTHPCPPQRPSDYGVEGLSHQRDSYQRTTHPRQPCALSHEGEGLLHQRDHNQRSYTHPRQPRALSEEGEGLPHQRDHDQRSSTPPRQPHPSSGGGEGRPQLPHYQRPAQTRQPYVQPEGDEGHSHQHQQKRPRLADGRTTGQVGIHRRQGIHGQEPQPGAGGGAGQAESESWLHELVVAYVRVHVWAQAHINQRLLVPAFRWVSIRCFTVCIWMGYVAGGVRYLRYI